AEINEEALVEFQAALFGVRIDLQHKRTVLGDVGIELVVPTAEERVGHVQALAVEAQLQHLRAAAGRAAAKLRSLAEQPANPGLAGQFGLGRIADVILSY